MKLVIGVLVATFGLGTLASASCLDTAIAAIEAKGVTDWEKTGDRAPILEKVYQKGDDSSSLIGYHAWFRVERCPKGYVVVNMVTSCRITDIYDRDGCNVLDGE